MHCIQHRTVGTAGAQGQFPSNDGQLGAVWASVARLRPWAAACEGLKPWDQGPGRGSHVDPLQPAPQHPPAAAQLGAAGVCCPLHTGPGRWGVGPGHKSPVHLRARAPLPHFLESRFPRAFQRQGATGARGTSRAVIYVSFTSVRIGCGVAAGPRAVTLGSWASGTFLLLLWPQPGARRSLALCSLPRLFLVVLDCGVCVFRK